MIGYPGVRKKCLPLLYTMGSMVMWQSPCKPSNHKPQQTVFLPEISQQLSATLVRAGIHAFPLLSQLSDRP